MEQDVAPDLHRELAADLDRAGLVAPAPRPTEASGCSVLEWARSGAMWLTGPADGPPCWPEGPVLGRLAAAAAGITGFAAALGRQVRPDAVDEVTVRARVRGFRRAGQVSAGGWCRLVAAADGWLAVNLARPDDRALVALATGGGGEPWSDLTRAAVSTGAGELVDRLQLLGVPAAALPSTGRRRTGQRPAPFTVTELGPTADVDGRVPLVLDLSAMWAGPLCASLLGAAGARVVKVEDPDRPDAARIGDPALYDRLHAGQECVAVSFRTPAGRAELAALFDQADVVLEASRPRALSNLGLGPETFLGARPGRTWISVTGYGRTGPWSNRVAFGDDAAVAGGLVAWTADGQPVFCADAIADPVTGIYAALGGLAAMASGGGRLVDVSMAGASAHADWGTGCPGPHPVTEVAPGRWVVGHGEEVAEVVPP